MLIDGGLGQVIVDDFHKDGSGWCIVHREGHSLNTLRPPFELTKIDPVFAKLLTDVNKEE